MLLEAGPCVAEEIGGCSEEDGAVLSPVSEGESLGGDVDLD